MPFMFWYGFMAGMQIGGGLGLIFFALILELVGKSKPNHSGG